MQTTKDRNRADILNKLGSISPGLLREASEQASNLLSQLLDQISLSQIVTFLPTMRGELDFLPVLRRFASQAEIYAVSPIEHSLTGDLTLYRLTAESLSDPSSKGRDAAKAILKQGRTIELSTLDSVGVVLVPGLAFDRTGARLGRGGGFYDRLLARPEFLLAQKIAVCLQMQILDSVPIEPHDAHVDIIVTETEIHRIRTLSS